MSEKNGHDYLYLIWRAEKTRKQFIVGILSKNSKYEFQYYNDLTDATKEGFTPLVAFPDVTKTYTSECLFQTFSSRLPDRKRKDIDKILKKYEMKDYNQYELLKRSGAKLPIDNLEFIDPILNYDESFSRNFYLAGARHHLGCNGKDCELSVEVTRGDEVFLEPEPENDSYKNAVAVYNFYRNRIGYIPRYYSEGLSKLLKINRNVHCFVKNVEKLKENCSECIRLNLQVE
jgi:hypothetical protein